MANLKSGTSIGGALALFDGVINPTFTNIVKVVGSLSDSTPTNILLLGRDYNAGVAYASVASLALSNNVSNTRLDIKLLYANNSSIVAPDTTVMTLLSSGKIGIGTTAPIRPLHINGELSLSNNGGGCYLNVHDTAGNAGVNLQIRGLSTGGTAEAACTVAITGTLGISGNITAANLGTASSNATGDFSAAPSYSNDSNSSYQMLWGSGAGVYGTAGIYCNPATDYLYAGVFAAVSGYTSTHWTTGYVHSYSASQAHSDYLINNGADTTSGTLTATNFILSSDKKLKINIIPLKNSSINIEYKEFELISEPGQKRYGVIAQDLKKTNPELVRKGEDGMLSVAYFDLLILEINSLKERVKELEGRIK